MDVFSFAFPAEIIEFAKGEKYEGGPGKECNKAQSTPEDGIAAGGIANQGIVGEIIRVREGFVWAPGHGGPGCPGKKGGKLPEFRLVLYVPGHQTPAYTRLVKVRFPFLHLFSEGSDFRGRVA
jgi:hypothetical protein